MISIPEHIEEQIEELASNITAAQNALYDGHTIEITQIEEKTAALCKNIEELPPNQSQGCHEFLEILFQEIEFLEKSLELQHDALTEQLQLKEKGANPLFAQEVGNLDDET